MPLICDTSHCGQEATTRVEGVDVGGEAYALVACDGCASGWAEKGAYTTALSQAERDEIDLLEYEERHEEARW